MFVVCLLECLTFDVAVTVTELFILRYPVSLLFQEQIGTETMMSSMTSYWRSVATSGLDGIKSVVGSDVKRQ